MKIPRRLLPKEDREIMRICDDLNTYWRTNDNFVVALERYLEDLNFKYKLELSPTELHEIPSRIAFILFNDYELRQGNVIYIFAQFIYYFIFKGLSPRHIDIEAKELLQKANNIQTYLAPPETNIGGFRAVIDKRYAP